MDLVRVIYVVVDTRQLTLYKDDGEKLFIPQGDPRVKRIVEEYLPMIDRDGVVEMDLSTVESNAYREFEEKSGGVVRFFKVAAKKLASFFGATDIPVVPEGEHGELPPVILKPTMQDFAREVVANAKLAEPVKDEPTELVAVVGDTIIPKVEQLSEQIKHAAKLGSTKGMEAFFKRIAPVMEKRRHSVDDLLRFMEKADLPVADDGCIIAYKRLQAHGDHFVDCHTRRVTQRVGSLVCVDETLVDPNRYNECSNGLHIARRGYLKSFNGNVCVLAKIAPEDVIAVPHNDPDKVRVCRYHIIEKLSKEAFDAVCSDRPMTDNAAVRTMLARAIAGDHPAPIEEVRITEQQGRGLKITPLGEFREVKPTVTITSEDIENARAFDDAKVTEAPTVKPIDAAKQIKAARNQAKEEEPVKPYTPLTRQEQAAEIVKNLLALETPGDLRRAAAHELRALKRKAKITWAALGVGPDAIRMMDEIQANEPAQPKVSTKVKALSQKMNAAKIAETQAKPTANDNIREERDKEVARLHGLGKSQSEIAKALGIHRRSVGRIISKFG